MKDENRTLMRRITFSNYSDFYLYIFFKLRCVGIEEDALGGMWIIVGGYMRGFNLKKL